MAVEPLDPRQLTVMLGRLRALLRMADPAQNNEPYQRRAAAQMVAKLMRRYGITQAQIDASGGTHEERQAPLHSNRVQRGWRRILLVRIASVRWCSAVWWNGQDSARIVGEPDDVAWCLRTFDRLAPEIERLARQDYGVLHGGHLLPALADIPWTRFRSQFGIGAASEAGTMLREAQPKDDRIIREELDRATPDERALTTRVATDLERQAATEAALHVRHPKVLVRDKPLRIKNATRAAVDRQLRERGRMYARVYLRMFAELQPAPEPPAHQPVPGTDEYVARFTGGRDPGQPDPRTGLYGSASPVWGTGLAVPGLPQGINLGDLAASARRAGDAMGQARQRATGTQWERILRGEAPGADDDADEQRDPLGMDKAGELERHGTLDDTGPEPGQEYGQE